MSEEMKILVNRKKEYNDYKKIQDEFKESEEMLDYYKNNFINYKDILCKYITDNKSILNDIDLNKKQNKYNDKVSAYTFVFVSSLIAITTGLMEKDPSVNYKLTINAFIIGAFSTVVFQIPNIKRETRNIELINKNNELCDKFERIEFIVELYSELIDNLIFNVKKTINEYGKDSEDELVLEMKENLTKKYSKILELTYN